MMLFDPGQGFDASTVWHASGALADGAAEGLKIIRQTIRGWPGMTAKIAWSVILHSAGTDPTAIAVGATRFGHCGIGAGGHDLHLIRTLRS